MGTIQVIVEPTFRTVGPDMDWFLNIKKTDPVHAFNQDQTIKQTTSWAYIKLHLGNLEGLDLVPALRRPVAPPVTPVTGNWVWEVTKQSNRGQIVIQAS